MITSLSEHQAKLLATRQPFFKEVADAVLPVVPRAQSIICYGLNVLNENRINPNDWDFIVMLPPDANPSELERLNRLTSPLAVIRSIGTHRIDVQALSVEDNSTFAQLLQREGMTIWENGSKPNIEDQKTQFLRKAS